MYSFDVRLGRLIWTGGDKFRQKGVDTLIAIDMITKAYEKQYDEAILIAGDLDFLEVVEAVKRVGIKITGSYFEKNTRKELLHALIRELFWIRNF